MCHYAAATQWEKRRRDRASRRQENNRRSRESSDPHGDDGAFASKSKHNLVFAQWLVDTFGVDALMGGGGGGGVIDIAGGRGMLSLELALTYDVQPAYLVEPLRLRLNKAFQRRVKKWRRRRKEAAVADEGKREEDLEVPPLGDGGKEKMKTNEPPVGEAAEDAVDTDDDEEDDARRAATAAEAEEAGDENGNGNATANLEATEEMPVRHVQAEFHGLDRSAEDVVAALRSAGTILAMHPDAPTVGYRLYELNDVHP